MMLCISKDNPVWRIPLRQLNKKEIKNEKLANKKTLITEIIYNLENRKPKHILHVTFDDLEFNQNGKAYININSNKVRGVLEYIYHERTGDNKNIPMPTAPIEPTAEELFILKSYLNKIHPVLLENSPYAIENSIIENRNIHDEHLDLLKSQYHYPDNRG